MGFFSKLSRRDSKETLAAAETLSLLRHKAFQAGSPRPRPVLKVRLQELQSVHDGMDTADEDHLKASGRFHSLGLQGRSGVVVRYG